MTTTLLDDLWARIFIAIGNENPGWVWALRSVNIHWYNIATSTPLLWADISLNCEGRLHNQDFVQLLLSMSGQVPLKVTIHLPDYMPSTDLVAERTLKSFRQAASRLKVLHMSLGDIHTVEFFLAAMGHGQSAPLLEALDIFVQRNSTLTYDNLPFNWLTTCLTPSPRLRRLTIPPEPLPDATWASSRLSTIMFIDMPSIFSQIETERALPFLKAAKCLERFRYSGRDLHTFLPTANPNYPHIFDTACLQAVDVTVPGTGADILRNINAPLLSHARLTAWRARYGPIWWEDSLTAPISATILRVSIRSLNLRSLHLDYIRLHQPDKEYGHILTGSWFPNLEELLMNALEVSDQHFIAASPKSTSLKTLKVLKCKHVTADGLRPFVAGRRQGFSLVLELRGEVLEASFEGLSELCGLQFVTSDVRTR